MSKSGEHSDYNDAQTTKPKEEDDSSVIEEGDEAEYQAVSAAAIKGPFQLTFGGRTDFKFADKHAGDLYLFNETNDSDKDDEAMKNKIIQFLTGITNLSVFFITLQNAAGYLSGHSENEPVELNELNPVILNALRQIGYIKANQTSLLPGELSPKINNILKIAGELMNRSGFEKLFQHFLYDIGNADRPRRKKILNAITAVKERLTEALQISGKPLMQGGDDLRTYGKRLHEEMQGIVVELVENSFITKEINGMALYSRPDLWMSLGLNPEYVPGKTGKELLEKNLHEIITMVSKGKKKMKIFDLGIGTGEKAEIIIGKFLLQGKKIEYHAVDSSDRMLWAAVNLISDSLLKKVLDEKEKPYISEEFIKWKPLIDFIKKTNLNQLVHRLLNEQLERIFYKFTDPEFHKRFLSDKKTKPELLKHLFARMLSLHVRRNSEQTSLINEIDEELDLPVDLIPRCQLIETLNCKDYKAEEDQGLVAFDLGCRMCNLPPSESIKDYQKFLSFAEVDKDHDLVEKKNTDEDHVRAPYLVVGVQISHFDESDPENYKKEEQHLKKGYDTPQSEAFILHPFVNLNYRDANTGEVLNFYQLRDKKRREGNPYCEFITEYKDDPQYKDRHEKRITHKLRFNRAITAIGKVKTSIPKGHEIFLMASYKPSLEQLIELYTTNQIHICKIYMDNPEKPEYIKLVLRKMTPVEMEIPPGERIEQLKAKFCAGFKRTNQEQQAQKIAPEIFRHSGGVPSSEIQ